uniref:DUF4445 domain-containing protein n=1 Tax=candidate division WOR-3 bacterium TaxID=2052148 RepID=A0A7C3Z257_UNCW3
MVEKTSAIGLALDIGTTLLKGATVNLRTGKVKKKARVLNPQNRLGSDIITRVSEATSGKYHLLRRLLLLGIGVLKRELGGSKSSFTIVVGNPVNLSFYLNQPVDGFKYYPFQGELQEGVFLNSPSSYIFPCLGGFVGGDTIAGLLASGLDHFPYPSLYIDLGTNGEVALILSDRILVTSTAAGPALESHYLRLNYPKARLCASNLISILANSLRKGWVREDGRLLKEISIKGVKISQEDIRRFQLAVGAIHTGVEILLEKAQLSPSDIKRIVITGEFGFRLSSEDLIRVGLISGEIKEVIKKRDLPLKGAIMCVRNRNLIANAEEIRRRAEHIELALIPNFPKRFVSALRLAPWT